MSKQRSERPRFIGTQQRQYDDPFLRSERRRKRKGDLRWLEQALAAVPDRIPEEKPISVQIKNDSAYQILYSIQSDVPSGADRYSWLDSGEQSPKLNMRKDEVHDWPTLNLVYAPESGPIKEIDSYKPSKYIPNLYVTIKNDGDILDVQYEEF